MTMNRALLLLASVLLFGGCAREERVNVLLVTVDTARADRFGCYGYAEPSSPNIDLLASEGALFLQTYCTNPITLPSHASIMTGTYPIFHGVRDNSTFVVRPDVTTLAEVMREAGYDTGAVIGAFVLDSRFNLDQGFAAYDDQLAEGWSKDELELRAANAFGFAERKANLVTVAALKWLRRSRSAPFFLWLHYFDPHQPVNPPEPHRSRFSEPYAGEIAYADEQLGPVIAELKEQGLYKRTLIVVTSDHGEGLMDHGEPSHALLVFDSVMRVPLIVRMPGEPPGLRLEPLCSTVDIMPTILDLLGLEIPADVQGRSLAPLVKGYKVESAPRALYMESMVPLLQCGWGPLRALRKADVKLIHGPKPRLYRVDEDPGELTNLAAREPETVTRLTAELGEAISRWSSEDAGGSSVPSDEETLRKLASLGYITGGGGNTGELTRSLADVQGMDDPHENKWLFDMIGVASENVRIGLLQTGIEQLQEVIAADPDNPSALNYLGKAYLQLKVDPRLARDCFERSLAVSPEQEEPRCILSRMLRAAGDREGARRQAEMVLEFHPQSVAALYEMASICGSEGDTVQAQGLYEHLLEIDETHIGALVELGIIHGKRHEIEQAGLYFKKALDIEPDNPKVLFNVGVWNLQGGNTDEAIAALSKAVSRDPWHAEAHFVLGKLLFERHERDRAREVLLVAGRLAVWQSRRQMIDDMLRELGVSSSESASP